MALGKLWAGKAFGTNIGNLFLRLDGDDATLTGTLHFNESAVGIAVYNVEAKFDGTRLAIAGKIVNQIEGFTFGDLEASGSLNATGQFDGEWKTTIGSAGTFVLFPHDTTNLPSEVDPSADQFHTARHQFQAIEINRSQITQFAEEIQKEFTKRKVVMTLVAGTEQSRFLEDFKQLTFNADRAEIIKIFAQEPEIGGISRVVSVEFGPQVNSAMTQGANEAWVLGKLETLKRDLRRFERTYTTNFKRLGVGINQLLLASTIVVVPGLSNLRDRVVYMIATIGLVAAVNWLHTRYLPFAAIYLREKPQSMFKKLSPSIASWIIALTAGTIATLLAAYLQGYLHLPSTETSNVSGQTVSPSKQIN